MDAWQHRPAPVIIEGDEAVISVEVGPRDVGCVVRDARGEGGGRRRRAELSDWHHLGREEPSLREARGRAAPAVRAARQ